MKNNKSPLEAISRVVPVLVPPAAGVPVVRHEALPVPASVCAVCKTVEAAASPVPIPVPQQPPESLPTANVVI